MDLKEFYFNNIQDNEYHHRFYDSIKTVNEIYNIFSGVEEVNDYQFEVFDAEEAIIKFRIVSGNPRQFNYRDESANCAYLHS